MYWFILIIFCCLWLDYSLFNKYLKARFFLFIFMYLLFLFKNFQISWLFLFVSINTLLLNHLSACVWYSSIHYSIYNIPNSIYFLCIPFKFMCMFGVPTGKFVSWDVVKFIRILGVFFSHLNLHTNHQIKCFYFYKIYSIWTQIKL